MHLRDISYRKYCPWKMSSLPKIPGWWGLNRVCPLISPLGPNNVRARYEEERFLKRERALRGADVAVRKTESLGWKKTCFQIFYRHIHIPAEYTPCWKLFEVENPTVFVRFEVASDWHPFPLAPNCLDTDDGRRVGLRVSKIIDGREEFFHKWVDSKRAPLYANSIFDWLQGVVEDLATHNWAPDRFPFNGTRVPSWAAQARQWRSSWQLELPIKRRTRN